MKETFDAEKRWKALKERKNRIAVVGLGYVGLPLAVAFSDSFLVMGMDINSEKIRKYRQGQDPTNEVTDEVLQKAAVDFTDDPASIRDASVIVVAVPTPIHPDKTPDLTPVTEASRLVGKNLSRGSIVCFESTVYPGVTEDICAPLIEETSGLVCGEDFFIAYSPERVNPGDRTHTVRTVTKIVSAAQPEVLELLSRVYGSVTGSIYKAETIKVAEAAKLLENSQRDVNIAFMNEIAMGLHRMGIDTAQVIRAMQTKWNALGFWPGLVGGHCIGIDPYYFTYETEQMGYHASLISTARRINDDLPSAIADEIVKELVRSGSNPSKCRVYILGMTFKKDCPDLRNTKSETLKNCLEQIGLHIQISDAMADPGEMEAIFRQKPVALEQIREADCLIFATDHSAYHKLSVEQVTSMLSKDGPRLVVDIRNLFRREDFAGTGCRYWNL